MRYFQRASEYLAENYPVCARGMLFSQDEKTRRELVPIAEQVLEWYAAAATDEEEALRKGLDGLAVMSYDFIRLQSRFQKNKCYRRQLGQESLSELYENEERMLGDYLGGLFLSYAFWTNHVRLYEFFRDRFPRYLKEARQVLEIGVGHGLMALTLLSGSENIRYVGADFSPHSIHYAEGVLKSVLGSWDDGRIRFVRADVTLDQYWGDGVIPNRDVDAIVCCEVLEHINDPQSLLERIRMALSSNGHAFLTTVANIEAEDHVYLYESLDHIRTEIRKAGLSVVEEFSAVLAGFENDEMTPYNYGAIVRPS